MGANAAEVLQHLRASDSITYWKVRSFVRDIIQGGRPLLSGRYSYCLLTTVVSSTATSPSTLTRMTAPALTVQ